MFVPRVPAVLCILVALISRPLSAQAPQQWTEPQACETAIPGNVDAGMLSADVLALLRRSATFRRQCERVSRDTRVHVAIDIVSMLDGGRAQTVIRRSRGGTLQAHVSMLFGEDYRELLAHEFEHVIEQIDGVDLRAEMADGRAWLLPTGAFETRRALAAGLEVQHEAAPTSAHLHGVQPFR